MKKSFLKPLLIFLNLVCLIVALIWFFEEKKPEPIITSLTLLGNLIVLTLTDKEAIANSITMKSKGGKKSKIYQAGRDLKIK